jgi:hypothetical protein
MNNNQVVDAIEKTITNKINQVNTAIAGEIISWNKGSNRAVVKPKGNIPFPDGRILPYPTISNVPIIFPCGMGGKAGITFPVVGGDGCLLVFSQDNMQTFLSKTNTEDQRKFQLSDAFCIPGLYSGSTPTAVSNPNDVCLSNGEGKVYLGSDGFNGTTADGTMFGFSGGDLVVNGISLVNHLHGGVQTGGGNTGKPL